jgi:ferredoxin-NADP reductase
MELVLKSKQPLAGNAWLFTFEPTGPLPWVAGQFVRVELPHDRPDPEGTKRQFTIASAPSDGVVQIATRMTASTFKQSLYHLGAGGRLRVVDPPAGDFVWPNPASRPLVFVAQGIGITPIRSLMRQRLSEHRSLDGRLFHANLAPGIPFQAEIEHWAARGLHVTFLSQPVTPALLAHLIPDLRSAGVFVSGPISLTKLMLPPVSLPSAQIKFDQFPNYAAPDY